MSAKSPQNLSAMQRLLKSGTVGALLPDAGDVPLRQLYRLVTQTVRRTPTKDSSATAPDEAE